MKRFLMPLKGGGKIAFTAMYFNMVAYVGRLPVTIGFLARMKSKNDYLLFCHSVIWTGCIGIGLIIFGLFAWWKIAMLLVGHFLIDRWKARKPDKTHLLTRDLWIDQGLHFIQLLVCLA